MAKSFLKTKGAMKTLPQKAANAGLRIGGAMGAGYLTNKVIGDKVNKKYHGAILLAVGLAGEVLIENPQVAAVAQGITVMGGLQVMSKNVMPDKAADFGLSGDDGFEDYEELNGYDDTPSEFEDTPVDGIEEAAEMLSGWEEDNAFSGNVLTPEEVAAANELD